MPFESPILSLRESYRPVPRTPTVVMPLLIAALMTGLAAFYLKTRPAPESTATFVPMLIAKPIETEAPEETPTEPSPNEAPPAAPPLVAPMNLSEADFTPWLSPLALETYIRAKNRGSRADFWQQGHWIRAVEGRWREGALEFRIAVGKIEPGQRFRWQYRVDMTEREFTEALGQLGGEGFRLVHSYVYLRPGGERRYQAVWWTGSVDPNAEDENLVRR